MYEEDGFSLLETVIAVAIMAFAFAVLFPIFSDNYARIKNNEQKQYAHTIAVNALNIAVLQVEKGKVPKDGQNSDWKWTVTTTVLGKKPEEESSNGYAHEVSVSMFKIDEDELRFALSKTVWVYP